MAFHAKAITPSQWFTGNNHSTSSKDITGSREIEYVTSKPHEKLAYRNAVYIDHMESRTTEAD